MLGAEPRHNWETQKPAEFLVSSAGFCVFVGWAASIGFSGPVRKNEKGFGEPKPFHFRIAQKGTQARPMTCHQRRVVVKP